MRRRLQQTPYSLPAAALLAIGVDACGLSACGRGPPPSAVAPAAAPSQAGALDAARLAAASSEPDQWFTSGRDGAGSYYSPLADINASNVARLGFAWQYSLGTRRGLEATPLMIDGTLYASGNFGRVYAVDAATGKERWIYDPGVDGQWGRYACCDAVNRGVAVWKGRVYVGSLDGYLHAIDAATGKRLWKVDTLPARGPNALHAVGRAGNRRQARHRGQRRCRLRRRPWLRGRVRSGYGGVPLALLYGTARPQRGTPGPAASGRGGEDLGSAASLGSRQ